MPPGHIYKGWREEEANPHRARPKCGVLLGLPSRIPPPTWNRKREGRRRETKEKGKGTRRNGKRGEEAKEGKEERREGRNKRERKKEIAE